MRQGSVVALGQLFELHRARLERIILLRLDSRIARRLSEQDVLQEVYLRASNRLEHFASRTTLSAFMWFRLLAYQQLTELYRRHLGSEMRDVRRETYSWPNSSSVVLSSIAIQLRARNTDTPSQTFSREETTVRLEEVLGQLHSFDRQIIFLRHFEELSNAEAAVALDLSPSAARKRYFRALRRLRDRLNATDWNEQ